MQLINRRRLSMAEIEEEARAQRERFLALASRLHIHIQPSARRRNIGVLICGPLNSIPNYGRQVVTGHRRPHPSLELMDDEPSCFGKHPADAF